MAGAAHAFGRPPGFPTGGRATRRGQASSTTAPRDWCRPSGGGSTSTWTRPPGSATGAEARTSAASRSGRRPTRRAVSRAVRRSCRRASPRRGLGEALARGADAELVRRAARDGLRRSKDSRLACRRGPRRTSGPCRSYHAGLPKVRRLLANVPTYMTFDDHEVTDDWNINGAWVAAGQRRPARARGAAQRAARLRPVPGLGQRPRLLLPPRRPRATAERTRQATCSQQAGRMFLDAAGDPLPPGTRRRARRRPRPPLQPRYDAHAAAAAGALALPRSVARATRC